MSLKPIPKLVLMEIVVELYVRGFEAGVLLLCSGLEEKRCQNNSCVPTMRKRAANGSFLLWKVHLLKYSTVILRHLIFL